jgi:hypothetical protein
MMPLRSSATFFSGALLALVLLPACPDTDNLCQDDFDCPKTAHCSIGQGICVEGAPKDPDNTNAADAGTPKNDGGSSSENDSGSGNDLAQTGDAGPAPDGGGAPSAACGRAGVVDQDFESSEFDQMWTAAWGNPGELSWSISGGVLVFTAEAGAFDAYAGYGTPYTIDLTDGSLSIALSVPPQLGDQVNVSFRLQSGEESFVQIGILDDQLYTNGCDWTGSNCIGLNLDTTRPFDDAQHHHWRFRESSNTFFIETSGDGQTWTELASTGSPAFLTRVVPGLNVHRAAGKSAQSIVAFDDFMGTSGPTQWCPADSYDDAFNGSDGPMNSFRWGSYGTGASECALFRTNNQAGVEIDLPAGASCAASSNYVYSLEDSTISVRLVDRADTGGELLMGLSFSTLPSGFVRFGLIGSRTFIQVPSSLTGEAPYEEDTGSAGNFPRISISESNDVLTFRGYDESDAEIFRRDVPVAIPFDGVAPNLWLENRGQQDIGPDVAIFDDYNRLP